MDEQLRGAIMGAIVGNTLGAPLRGRTDYHKLNYYEPIPVRMAPSEALDAWLVWNHHLAKGLAPQLLSKSLLESWTYKTQETAFALANLERGFAAPLSGRFQNPISNGAQAFGRTAFWGIALRGDPDKAAEYAYYDASIDHTGDGIACAVALAFAGANATSGVLPTQLVRAAASALPLDSQGLKLLNIAIKSASNSDGPQAARDAILDQIDHQDPYDASLNFGFIVLGLLLGAGEFGSSVRITASLGGASDQNAMAVGALMGATGTINPEWLDPLGEDYVSGHGLRGIEPSKTVESFIQGIARVAAARVPAVAEVVPTTSISAGEGSSVVDAAPSASSDPSATDDAAATTDLDAPVLDEPASAAAPSPANKFPTSVRTLILNPSQTSASALRGAQTTIEYLDGPVAYPGKNSQMVATFVNNGDKELVIDPALDAPAGWSVAHKLASFRLRPGESSSFPIVVQPPKDAALPNVINVRLALNKGELVAHFVAAQRWYWVGPFENIEGTGFDKTYRPQDIQNTKEVFNGRSNQAVRWTEGAWPGTFFDLEPMFKSGPGALFLYSKLTFPAHGKYKIVCAASTGAIVYINQQKVIWYQDTRQPVPRALLPYVAEFDANGEMAVLVKVLRNKEPLLPLVLYFISEDGSIITPAQFGVME